MDSESFEGSKVLEILAGQGLVEDFYDAIDCDNFSKAILLMRQANIDEQTIEIVIAKIYQSDVSH